jgi:hypothetical protein
MGAFVSNVMDEKSGEPTLDEFLRQLQAEMDIADKIPDKEERGQRQWQIEAAMQEAITFSNRWKHMMKLGRDPLKLVEAIADEEMAAARRNHTPAASAVGACNKCSALIEGGLDFCPSCGHYFE